MGEIAVHILLGFLDGDSDILGQGEGGNAVNDAKIYRFRASPHAGGHLLHRYAEDLGGGEGVDILSGAEAVDHGLVPGHVGQQAQLDLGVVGVHQHLSGGCGEHLPQLRPQLGADGDVLQIGLGGAEPPGGGDGVLEGGVDAPIGADDLGQAVGVGGFQLGELAVLQDAVNNGVLPPELVQHVGVGGVARLGLLHRG